MLQPDRFPHFEQFRVTLLDLIKEVRSLLPAVKDCTGSIDRINELALLRNRGEDALSIEIALLFRLQNTSQDEIEIARQQEEVTRRRKQVDTYNQEIGQLLEPFPIAQRRRDKLVRELRNLLNSMPIEPSILREIRGEVERLALLTDTQVGMQKTYDELQILEQRLEEIRKHLERGERTHTSFPTPSGAKWEDVAIRFLSDHRIEVIVLGQRATYNYAEAGFEDRRSRNPVLSWVSLRELARNGGRVDRPVALANRKNLGKNIRDLRKRLKRLFELEDDPINSYHQMKCYQAHDSKFPSQRRMSYR